MDDTFHDENLSKMLKAAQQNIPNKQETTAAILAFRNNLNLKWISQFDYPKPKLITFIKDIFIICFKLIEHHDQQINICVQSILGKVIYFIGNFIPGVVVEAFLEAVQNTNPSKDVSIAVIACYCEITRYVPFIHKQEFVSSFPILIFCRQEITSDLKYLPKLFSRMKSINSDIDFVILRTIMKSFNSVMTSQQNPLITTNLIKSLYELIKTSPMTLEFQGELLKNEKIALMIFPMILQNPKLSHFLYKVDVVMIFNIAVNILKNKDKHNLTDFEQSCLIVAILLSMQSDNRANFIQGKDLQQNDLDANDSKKKESMNDKLGVFDDFEFKIDFEIDFSSLPQNLWVFAYKLSNDLSLITPDKEKDKISIQTQKIDAIKYYLRRNPQNAFQCLLLLENFMDTKSEVFSHTIDTLTSIIEFFDAQFSKLQNKDAIMEKLKTLFFKIFSLKVKNWVHKLSICHLLETIYLYNSFYIPYLPFFKSNQKSEKTIFTDKERTDLRKQSIQFLLESAISKQVNLCNDSLSIFLEIVRKDDFLILSEFITHQDMFDDYINSRILLIMNKTAKIFGYDLFAPFDSLVIELFFASQSINSLEQSLIYINRSKTLVLTPYLSSKVEKLFYKLLQGFIGYDLSSYPASSTQNQQNQPQIGSLPKKIPKVSIERISKSDHSESGSGSLPSPLNSPPDSPKTRQRQSSMIQRPLNETPKTRERQTSLLSRPNSTSPVASQNQTSSQYQQVSLQSAGSQSTCIDEFKFITSDIETNIVTRSFDDQKGYLRAFKECLSFMLKNQELPPLVFNSILVCLNVVDIDVLVEFFLKYKEQYKFIFVNKLTSLVNSTVKIEIASKAADVASQLGIENEKLIKNVVAHLQTKTYNGEQLYRFSKLVSSPTIIQFSSNLAVPDAALFYLLYSHDKNIPIELTKQMDFEEWPLYNETYKNLIDKNIDLIKPVIIKKKKSVFDTHNSIQQEFISKHLNCFTYEDLGERAKNKFISSEKSLFQPKPIHNVSKESSILPSLFIKNEKIEENEILLKNFCNFSTAEISDQQFYELTKILIAKKLFESLFVLSLSQKKFIREDLLTEQILNQLNDDELYLCAQCYTTIPKKSKIVESFFNSLSQNFANPILDMKRNKKAKAVVAFSPEAAIKKFMVNFQPIPKLMRSLLLFESSFNSFSEFELTISLLYNESIEKQRKQELEDYIEDQKLQYQQQKGVEIPSFDNINEDEVLEHKDLTWLFRLARHFTFFTHKIPSEIEVLFQKAKTATEINEIVGICRHCTPKNYLNNIVLNSPNQILFLDGLALIGKINPELYNQMFTSIITSLPSFSMKCIRILRSVSSDVDTETFNSYFFTFFINFKENLSYIALIDLRDFLLFIVGTSVQTAAFETVINPLSQDMIKSLTLSSEKEIFNVLNPKSEIKKMNSGPAFLISEYFKNGTERPSFNFAAEMVREHKPLGAAYFVIGKIDILRFNFFDLYVMLFNIIRIMKNKDKRNQESKEESDYSQFIRVAKEQIVKNIKHTERRMAISYLLNGDFESIIKGARIAAAQNST